MIRQNHIRFKSRSMTNEKKWYAVYTRSKWEKKVSYLLTKKSIENYCPLMPVIRQWADRKKTVFEPVFTSYVFVRIGKDEYVSSLETEGVVHFIKESGLPLSIRHTEIEDVKKFLAMYDSVTVENIRFNVHDKVRILNGALASKEGEVKEVRKKTVCVLLPSVGFRLIAELDKDCLQKIAG